MSKYPWDSWLDGRVWALREGADFECTPSSMQSQCHVHAKKAGVYVTTHMTSIPGQYLVVLVQTYPSGSTWRPNLPQFPIKRLSRLLNADNPRNQRDTPDGVERPSVAA